VSQLGFLETPATMPPAMTEQPDLEIRASYRRLQPDTNLPLYHLTQQYESGELKAPPHQRTPDAWNRPKQFAWMDRLRHTADETAQPPLGTVCIYSLERSLSDQYLNDGLQRISTCSRARQTPHEYGFRDLTEVDAVLRSVFISVQNRTYREHQQAAKDFAAVNDGTGLDPAERHKMVLAYAERWDSLWSAEIQRWCESIDRAVTPFSSILDRRIAKLSRHRRYLQLFSLAHQQRPKSFGRDPRLEHYVVECFATSSRDIVTRHIRTAERYAAEIETAWRSYQPDLAQAMQETLACWCIGAMFLYAGSETPLWWQEFLAKLFRETGGNATFAWKNQKDRQRSLHLTKKFECFDHVCQALSHPRLDRQRRPSNRRRLRPGYQSDHVQPYVDFGDGPIQSLPARLNAAKAARQI
jgi:hypothetical protein